MSRERVHHLAIYNIIMDTCVCWKISWIICFLQTKMKHIPLIQLRFSVRLVFQLDTEPEFGYLMVFFIVFPVLEIVTFKHAASHILNLRYGSYIDEFFGETKIVWCILDTVSIILMCFRIQTSCFIPIASHAYYLFVYDSRLYESPIIVFSA